MWNYIEQNISFFSHSVQLICIWQLFLWAYKLQGISWKLSSLFVQWVHSDNYFIMLQCFLYLLDYSLLFWFFYNYNYINIQGSIFVSQTCRPVFKQIAWLLILQPSDQNKKCTHRKGILFSLSTAYLYLTAFSVSHVLLWSYIFLVFHRRWAACLCMMRLGLRLYQQSDCSSL